METKKWVPWLVIGGLAVVAFIMFSSGGTGAGGTSVITQAAPDTSASDAARFGFLGQAVSSLAGLEQAITADQYQYMAIRDGIAGQTAAAQAQADADKVAARAAAVGHRGLDLGPFHFHF